MFKKNVAVTGFPVGMVNASDGSAITTGTVNGYVSKDGGAQTTLTNSLSHKGNGQWAVDLTAVEMNADVVGLAFTHSSGIPQYFTIRTVSKLVADLNDLSAAQVNSEVDTALSDYDAPTKAELDAGLAALNDLSAAQVKAEADAALAEYDPPSKTELDAGLAALNNLSAAEVNTEAGNALAAYDPPTKAEVDSAIAGLNDLSAAQVNTEVSNALAVYDPPTKAEFDAAIAGLNNLSAAEINTEVNNALTVYDAPTKSELDTGFAALNNVSAAEIDAQLTGSHGGGSWSSGAAGSGARTVTVTVLENGSSDPIQNANVRLNAAGMPSVVAMTNANGQAVLYVDDAIYTMVTVAGSGYIADSRQLVVDGDENPTVLLNPVMALPQADPALCTVWVRLRQNGAFVEGGTMIAKLKNKNNAVQDSALSLAPQSVTTDANGYAELGLIREDQFTDGDKIYRIVVKDQYGNTCYDFSGTIPNDNIANLEDMI